MEKDKLSLSSYKKRKNPYPFYLDNNSNYK